MTNREFDALVMGFSAGAPVFLWLGYRIGAAAERWRSRRGAKRRAVAETLPGQDARAVLQRAPRRAEKPRLVPLTGRVAAPDLTDRHGSSREASEPRVVPLKRMPIPVIVDDHLNLIRRGTPPAASPQPTASEAAGAVEEWCTAWPEDDHLDRVRELNGDRADAIAALSAAGYKRVAAVVAVDACTEQERAGGLESWIAAALRRVATTK